MKIWNYLPVSGELIGEGVADPDPKDPGGFLLPAFSTPVSPPDHRAGSARVYDEASGSWRFVEDNRGQTRWRADGTEVTTTALGPVEAGLLSEPPARVLRLSCSRLQGRKALRRAGLLDNVKALVDQSADEDLKDTFEYADTWYSDDPYLTAMATALGITEEQRLDLFRLAKTL